MVKGDKTMKKDPLNYYGIDQYLYAVNDSAWRILNRSNTPWMYGTQPVYPLNWYISSGRAPTPFIRQLLTIRPDVIARILIRGGSDQEIVQRIRNRIGYASEGI